MSPAEAQHPQAGPEVDPQVWPEVDPQVYGLLRLAGAVLALPLSALREVVARPAQLEPLPVAAPGLLGALQLRALVVPVIDLRPRLGLPRGGAAAEHPVVVVVGAGEHLVGVVADEVLGITTVVAQDLLALRTPPPRLVRHVFRHPDREDAVSVLDPDVLLALPDVPSLRAPAATGRLRDDGERGPVRRLTLLRCGPHLLGLDSAYVHTLLPPVAPEPSVLTGGVCLGVTTYADREVAVVDPLALLGLGALPDGACGAGVVLDLPDGYAVLAVTALLDLAEVPEGRVLALPAFAVQRRELLSGLLDTDDGGRAYGQCLVLDGSALAADRELTTLAGLNTLLTEQAAGGGDSSGAGAGRRRSYLVYAAGHQVVTPLEQVVEIVPVPRTSTPTGAHPAVVGVVVHRGAAVPLLCLSTLLGGAPSVDPACALLVEVDGDPVAFVVGALRSIEPLSWEDAGAPAPRAAPRTPQELLRRGPLVQVGDAPGLLRELDLQCLARLVRDGAPSPGAEPADDVPLRAATLL